MNEREINLIVAAATARLKINLGENDYTVVATIASQAVRLTPYPLRVETVASSIRTFRLPPDIVPGNVETDSLLASVLRNERIRIWPDQSPFLIGPLVGLEMYGGSDKAKKVYTLIGYAIRQQHLLS